MGRNKEGLTALQIKVISAMAMDPTLTLAGVATMFNLHAPTVLRWIGEKGFKAKLRDVRINQARDRKTIRESRDLPPDEDRSAYGRWRRRDGQDDAPPEPELKAPPLSEQEARRLLVER